VTAALAEPAAPRRRDWGWAFLALVSPLWFLWRRRYAEFVLIFALLLVLHWRAIMASEGYVQMDALWVSLVGLVFLPFSIPATPILGPGSGGGWLLALMAGSAVWALFVATRPGARRRTWYSIVMTAGGLVLGYVAFQRLYIPGLKYRAYVGAMRRDLLDLATFMEASFADRVTYVVPRDSLPRPEHAGVTVRVTSMTTLGWSAIAQHNASSLHCGIFVGSGRLPWARAVEGEPLCVRTREVALRRPGMDELVREDFGRLVTVQDSFRASHGRYGASLQEIGFTRQGGMPFGMRGTPTGWVAEAMMQPHFHRHCAIAGGDGRNPVRADAPAGRMACRRM